jgi:hypothetical protein
MTTEPWRYTLAVWLVLLLLGPAYGWAWRTALGLLVFMVLATAIDVLRAARARRKGGP